MTAKWWRQILGFLLEFVQSVTKSKSLSVHYDVEHGNCGARIGSGLGSSVIGRGEDGES